MNLGIFSQLEVYAVEADISDLPKSNAFTPLKTDHNRHLDVKEMIATWSLGQELSQECFESTMPVPYKINKLI